jgi:hypothetical protein
MKTGKFIMGNGSELRIWQTSLGVNKPRAKQQPEAHGGAEDTEKA